jgi:outer membrane protein assembly factor BamD (BamD/ComL family)
VIALAVLAAGALTVWPLAAQTPPTGRPTPLPAGAGDTTVRQAVLDQAAMRRILGDSSIVPQENQAAGVEGEIRAALYELMNGRSISALSRLQWLTTSPTALGSSSDNGTVRNRENMLFLLAETYYTLGMDEPFRASARQLASNFSTSRYAPIINAQLMLDAYRRGDYAGAITISRSLGESQRALGIGSLVAGLSAYQLGNYTDARASFTAAAATGAPYGDYARYMDALTMLRADTASGAAALAALQALASGASGEFADQVRLTAAQLAYETEQYPVAVQLADAISRTGGLAAQAQFTRAWALYKSDQLAPAGEAFSDFATRFPQLPEREESRLMHGQVLLQLGRTAEAATLFRTVADSTNAAVTTLQARASGAMTDAARALVLARAAGLLFIRDPASGKTISLQDAAGAEPQLLATMFADTTGTMPAVRPPDVISLSDVMSRIDSITPSIDAVVPRRVVFAPASATRNRADFVLGSQALYEADVAVALARHRLDEQMEAQRLQLALLRRFQGILNADLQGFDTLTRGLTAAQDSLARVSAVLAAANTRLTQMFMAQVSATRMVAEENIAAIDSIRRGMSGGLAPADEAILAQERQTAEYYRSVAQAIQNGLSGAISRNPIFALSDSVRGRAARVATLLAEARGAGEETQRLLASAIAEMESMENDRVRALRASVASSEASRTTAESRLISVVDAELRARAGEMVAMLRRDTEAAEFGSASALFFQTMDAERNATATGTNDVTGATAPRPPAAPTTPSNPPK